MTDNLAILKLQLCLNLMGVAAKVAGKLFQFLKQELKTGNFVNTAIVRYKTSLLNTKKKKKKEKKINKNHATFCS